MIIYFIHFMAHINDSSLTLTKIPRTSGYHKSTAASPLPVGLLMAYLLRRFTLFVTSVFFDGQTFTARDLHCSLSVLRLMRQTE